jgi:hypothetical protein
MQELLLSPRQPPGQSCRLALPVTARALRQPRSRAWEPVLVLLAGFAATTCATSTTDYGAIADTGIGGSEAGGSEGGGTEGGSAPYDGAGPALADDAGDGATATVDGSLLPADAGPADGSTTTVIPPGDGAAPAGFWNPVGPIPAAKNNMTFVFLNRTNGKYKDSDVYWSFKNGAVTELHSIADRPTYDMPANASGRMYFYVGGPNSQYNDFIEFTIGNAFNGNTTRVDAYGLPLAIRLHCTDGYDIAVGDDYGLFQQDRAVTFQQFIDDVPVEFKHLAQINAPYQIVEPGRGQFKAGGQYQNYYDAYVNQVWTVQGYTAPKPGPNGSGLAAQPDLSAALYRHVAHLPKAQWKDSTQFYLMAPANYYARFWHKHGLLGRAYGFPYDDVNGWSSFISHNNQQYLLVAIGW